MSGLQQFQSHKIVGAFKIGTIATLKDGGAVLTAEDGQTDAIVSDEYVGKHSPEVGGYYVSYPDGYESWSPAEAFESGYREIPEAGAPHPTRRWFHFEHLPPTLRDTSRRFHDLARDMDGRLPNGAEKSAGLRKLLEAKDCFVRCEREVLGGEPEPKQAF